MQVVSESSETENKQKKIEVLIIGASGLKKKGFFTKPSPFAVVSVSSSQIKRTKSIKSTTNPVWNEKFLIFLEDEDVLVLQIYDEKQGVEGFLGVVNVPFSFFKENSFTTKRTFYFTLRKSNQEADVKGKIKASFEEQSDNISMRQITRSREEYCNREPQNTRVVFTNHVTVLADLPNGWEQRRTNTGRAYFINHSTQTTTWEDPRLRQQVIIEDQCGVHIKHLPMNLLGELPVGWERRVDSNMRILYVNHLLKMTTREDPRLERIKENKKEVEFHMKQSYFKSTQQKKILPYKTEFTVSRDYVVDDAFFVFQNTSLEKFKGSCLFYFKGEDGLDYGGVSNEFFFLVSKKITSPEYGLFEYCGDKMQFIKISTFNTLDAECEQLFLFFGYFIGFALFHGKLIDARFVSMFYKRILRKKGSFSSLKEFDSSIHNSLKWILENNVDNLEVAFSVNINRCGTIKEVDLKEKGASIKVTEENKQEYVELMTEWLLVEQTKPQMDLILRGINFFVSYSELSMFTENELELLLIGTDEIDVENWRENTRYEGCSSCDDIARWFWEYVEGLDQEKRKKLVQFITGTTRLPCGKFKCLRGADGVRLFTVVVDTHRSKEAFPTSQTCFNRLIFPLYSSYETLSSKLGYAIEETRGFGIE